VKIVARNRRASYDYEILETVEAGIVLTGQEAKSTRQGNVNLAGSYVSLVSGRPVLKNASIARYAFATGLEDYDPGRDRALLLSKTEIARISAKLDERGASLVPLEVRAGRHIKLLLGLGRGRKRLDKRHKIREREVSRKLKQGKEY
jgi:SsrA-binding protein